MSPSPPDSSAVKGRMTCEATGPARKDGSAWLATPSVDMSNVVMSGFQPRKPSCAGLEKECVSFQVQAAHLSLWAYGKASGFDLDLLPVGTHKP